MAEKAGKVGAVYAQTGSATTVTAKPIGTADNSTVLFYLQETVIDCESMTPSASGSFLAGSWSKSGGTSTQDVDTDEKEGTYCIKNAVSSVTDGDVCKCIFTMTTAQDWHDRTRINFWLKVSQATAEFENARFEVEDSDGDTSYWNLTFSTAYIRIDIDLANPNGHNGGDDADLTKVKKVQLSFEAEDGDIFDQQIDWIGITPKGITSNSIIYVGGTAVAIDDYVLTPSGTLTFTTAPVTGAITATYYYYDVAQTTGFFGWSFDRDCELLPTTDYQDSGHKTYIAALKAWTGSAERHWLTTETMDGWLGTERIVKFFTDASTDPQLRYEGWAIVKGDSITSAVETLVNESLSFEGSGLLSYVGE